MSRDGGLEALLEGVQDVKGYTHYNGEVELYYSDAIHAYYREIDGVKILIPSVTQITSCADKSGPLMWWAVGEGIEHMIDNAFEQPDLVRASFYAAKNKEPFIDGVLQPVALKVTALTEVGKLLNDVRCAHNKTSRTARDTGKEVHAWLEGLLKAHINSTHGGAIDQAFVDIYATNNPTPKGVVPDGQTISNEEKCCLAAIDWLIEHEMCPILTESKIFSKENNYSGTLDWLAWITWDGRRIKVIGDFKTSKSLHNEYRLQVAAYYAALTEEFNEHLDIEANVVLRLSKEDGSFETMFIPRVEIEADLDGFYGTLQMFVWFKQLDLIKKFNKPARVRKTAGTKKSTKVIKVPEREITPIPIG